MVCEPNETDVDINIPVVMLPQDAGQILKRNMRNSSHGKLEKEFDHFRYR